MALKYSSADRMIYLEVLKIIILKKKSGVLLILIGINLVDITWCLSNYGALSDIGVYCLFFFKQLYVCSNFTFVLLLHVDLYTDHLDVY